MPTLTPTYATGGKTKPQGLIYVQPGREMTNETLASTALDGLNGPFISDFLSAVLTHERCGRHLYRSAASRSNNPILKSKYEEFGRETERHVEILEQLIGRMGGDPNYVSPQARAVEASDNLTLESTFRFSGGLDVMTQEMAILDAVFLAESMDHANWQAMRTLAGELPGGEIRSAFEEAVDEVEAEEERHLGWARDTRAKLVTMQAKSKLLATAGAKAEEMVQQVKGWLSS